MQGRKESKNKNAPGPNGFPPPAPTLPWAQHPLIFYVCWFLLPPHVLHFGGDPLNLYTLFVLTRVYKMYEAIPRAKTRFVVLRLYKKSSAPVN